MSGPRAPDELLREATELHRQGRLDEAERLYDQLLDHDPAHFDALNRRAIVALQRGDFEEALRRVDLVLRVRPDAEAALSNKGTILISLERYGEALATFDRVIDLNPDDGDAHYNRGNALKALRRPLEALASYDKAIALRPDDADAYCNRGAALVDLQRFDEALASFDKAITLNPGYAHAHSNRGTALARLQRFDEALASFDEAVALHPDGADAHYNRGTALVHLQRFAEALASFDNAVALNPGSAATYTNRGTALAGLQRFDEALTSFDKALMLEPDNIDAFGHLANAALQSCDWKRMRQVAPILRQQVIENRTLISPFAMLNYSTEPAIQLNAARNCLQRRIPNRPTPLCQNTRYRHGKIRIAYLSGDFRAHPVAYAVSELFELHDRARFEVVGVSYGQNDASTERARIVKAFDRFHDVSNLSDAHAAKLLRDAEIDIAVDLAGFTEASRPEILALRPAPVQVNYLGYPGTMGADFIDYVIADPIVLPFEQSAFYTEKIVHLPDCYLVNDSKREIAATPTSRKAAGLPDAGFVFCCFNNNYKITPQLFDIWMRLLTEIEGSVLWLLQGNASARRNLCSEAEARGVASTRLVFAERLPLHQQHLARQRLADLFLDTLPYNAHTTASDALWAGLPFITCMGETFPGRVGASLLRAVGLPELVATTLVEYEGLARRLATSPLQLQSIRQKLKQNRPTCALFDSRRFARHIEAAYVRMWERHERGLPPESLSVSALPSSSTIT